MVRSGVSVNTAGVIFGVLVASTMLLVVWRHRHNQARGDSLHLIGTDKPHLTAAAGPSVPSG